MELKDILKETIDEINKRFSEYKDEYFRLGKTKIDRRNNNRIIDTQIIPFYQNDDMNVSVHLYINFNENKIELRTKHKFNSGPSIIYDKYIDKVPVKEEKSTGIKELDNWIKEMNKSLSTTYQDNPLYDKEDLVDMFMLHCKDYFLSAEKYYINKKLMDKLYEEMKRAEYKV